MYIFLSFSRSDFMHAMENDIKPAFGAAAEVLENFVSRGIINWGEPVQSKQKLFSYHFWVGFMCNITEMKLILYTKNFESLYQTGFQ